MKISLLVVTAACLLMCDSVSANARCDSQDAVPIVAGSPTQGKPNATTPYPAGQYPSKPHTKKPHTKTPVPTSPTPAPSNASTAPTTPSTSPSTPTPMPSTPGNKTFARFFDEANFHATFPNAIPLYTFQGLVDAAAKYPTFANTGNDTNDKRELAAFLGQTAHECDLFKAAEEYAKDTYPESQYCDNTSVPCAPGHRYHGRGPIQLSWNYNYYHAGQALGIDLLNQPELVATDKSITWQTALWYWMTPQGGRIIHDVVTLPDGFAQSTDIINGALECGPSAPNQINEQQRIKYYLQMCEKLGVTPVTTTSCNAGSTKSPTTAPSTPGGDSNKTFARYFDETKFKATFPSAIPLYTFQGLVDAAAKYPSFANTGNETNDKRELAAFLGQTAHECDLFKAAEEYAKDTYPESQYCDNSSVPCAPGHRYHGRGPIMLSWNYNYYHAGQALGIDLLHQPELVATDKSITWQTALWYWMTPQKAGRIIHDVVTLPDGFAQSTDIINGGLECGPSAPAKTNELQRIKYYKQMCEQLGVAPVDKTSCNA